MCEGVSLNTSDTILFMDGRSSERAFIQIIGRGLRLHKNKDCCIVCIPIDCQETLETALTALYYDTPDRTKIQSKILCEGFKTTVDCEKQISINNTKLRIIELDKEGKSLVNYKAELLLEFVEKMGRVPKQKEEYQGEKLGIFWMNIKKRRIKGIYAILFTNEILKKDYEQLQKLKDEKKDQEKLTPEDKARLLLEFVEIKERLPKQKEEYQGVKLGGFWADIKHREIKGIYAILFTNKTLKENYDKTQEKKRKRK